MSLRTYRIGEFANKLGVSPDFLKYQERFGILSPQQSAANYRFYPLHQASRVYGSLFYGHLGFSTHETSSLLNTHSITQILERMDARAQANKGEIRRLQVMNAAIEEVKTILERVEKGNTWYVEEAPARLFLPQVSEGSFIEDASMSAIVAEWTTWMPPTFSAKRISCHELNGEQQATQAESQWGFVIDLDKAELLGFLTDAPVQAVTGGRQLVLYQMLEFDTNAGTIDDMILDSLRMTVAEANVKVSGDIIQKVILKSHERDKDGTSSLVSVYHIPICS